jgi:predicted dithiol-disulfide oxidoreductase (DUF899 family)
MKIKFPNESGHYRTARNELLQQEIKLRHLMEDVAVARRALPHGGIIPTDYIFQQIDGTGKESNIKLSELFAPGKNSLVVYSFMFPRDRCDTRPGPKKGKTAQLPLVEGPCPSCTALIDQLESIVKHVSPRLNIVASAKSPISRINAFATEHGWTKMKLLSSLNNTYNHDYYGETDNGDQMPMMNVFHKEKDVIWHFWGSELLYAPAEEGQEYRHLGTIEPLWNLFDLIPEGRGGDWEEQHDY